MRCARMSVLEYSMMLVLASNSPRRKQLLALGGWEFIVHAVDLDECALPDEAPDAYVRRLAQEKALAAARLPQVQRLPDAQVVAADTAVVDWALPLSPAFPDSPAFPAQSGFAGQTGRAGWLCQDPG